MTPQRSWTLVASMLAVAALVANIPLAGPARSLEAFPGLRPTSSTSADTPAARAAYAYLKMVNDGSEKAVEDYERAYASASRRGSVEVSERVRRVVEMRLAWKRLSVEKTIGSWESGISLEVSTGSDERLVMKFEMSPTEPERLDGVIVSKAMKDNATDESSKPMTFEQVSEVVESAAKALEAGYVFPETAAKMGERVRGKLKRGEYDAVRHEAELAEVLTADLRSVSNDRHLWVRVSPRKDSAPVQVMSSVDEAKRDNYGFRKVEVLPGNIGYMRFDVFRDEDKAKQAASSAMNFLAHVDALIFDVRYNGGGSPEMVQYITSHLFDKVTHLNDMIDREGNVVESFSTLESVPGARIGADVPIYVLTSSRTFSGAEEFTYNLKNLKRATVVGETTGGGAHPVRGERLTDRFVMGVPYMRAHNPITKKNWEGTGVEPDIKARAADALEVAREDAINVLNSRREATGPN